MALRKSPVRTAALLAANRANAKKSTGPSTPHGKARVTLNPLQHGVYAVRLPDKLLRAGCRQDEARYRWFRKEIAATFGMGEGGDEEQAERMAAKLWCAAQDGASPGSKAGISFRFRAMALASTLPIKDSDCGPPAPDGADVLVAAAPLLDTAAAGQGDAARGAICAAALPARRVLEAPRVPEPRAQPLGRVDTGARSREVRAQLPSGQTGRREGDARSCP